MLHTKFRGNRPAGSGEETFSLWKFLRIDSVISVNLYQISFLSLVLNIYKKYFIYLKTYINYINIWYKLLLMTFELHNYMNY